MMGSNSILLTTRLISQVRGANRNVDSRGTAMMDLP